MTISVLRFLARRIPKAKPPHEHTFTLHPTQEIRTFHAFDYNHQYDGDPGYDHYEVKRFYLQSCPCGKIIRTDLSSEIIRA